MIRYACRTMAVVAMIAAAAGCQPSHLWHSDAASVPEQSGVLTPLEVDDAGVLFGTVRLGHARLRQGKIPCEGRETVVAVRGGIEQAWHFETAPPNIGEMIVDVPLDGATSLRDSTDGVLVRAGRSTLRYSNGLWRDAAGMTYPVAARATGRGIELRVPAAVIGSSRYPAELDPMIGAVFDLTDATTAGESIPVGYGGGQYLAMWDQDDGAATGVDVLATRVSAAGVVLDSTPIGISKIAGDQTVTRGYYGGAAAAWNGTEFLVAYRDVHTGTAQLRVARVGPGGNVLDGNGIVIATASVNSQSGAFGQVAIASDGAGFLVVWGQSDAAGAAIRAITVTATGSLGNSVTLSGTLDPGYVNGLAVAFVGGTYLAAYSGYASSTAVIAGSRVSTSGTLLDSNGWFSIESGGYAVVGVAAIGGTKAVVSFDDSAVSPGALHTRVDVAGPTATVLDSPQAIGNSAGGVTAYDGEYLMYLESGAARLHRIDVSAAPAQVDIVDLSVDPTSAVGLASDGAGTTIVTGRDPANNYVAAELVYDLPNGAACTSDTACQSLHCADGVCCSTACGGGASTDCQACSVAAGAPSDGTCATLSSAHTCRAANGACDLAEVCGGTSTSCPMDKFKAMGTTCRAKNGACDAAETCTGTTAGCPADAYAAVGTICRAAAGPCDIAESCSGTSNACPADAVEPSGSVCRSAVDVCDIAETCDGASTACPTDQLAPADTECRAAVPGGCDIAENCTGSAATCPPDVVVAAGTTCRASTAACDPEEDCNGTSASCPSDVGCQRDAGIDAPGSASGGDGGGTGPGQLNGADNPYASGCNVGGRGFGAWWLLAILVWLLRRRRHAAVAIASRVAFSGVAGAQPALPPDQSRIDEAARDFEEGNTALDNKDYAAAIRAFQAAYDVAPRPLLLFDLGQAYRLHGDITKALDAYERYLATGATGETADAARKRIDELQHALPAPSPPATAPPHPTVVAPAENSPLMQVGTAVQPAAPPTASGVGMRSEAPKPTTNDVAPSWRYRGLAAEIGASLGSYDAPVSRSPSLSAGLLGAVGAYVLSSSACTCSLSAGFAAAFDQTVGANNFQQSYFGGYLGVRWPSVAVRAGAGLDLLMGQPSTALGIAVDLTATLRVRDQLGVSVNGNLGRVDLSDSAQSMMVSFSVLRVGLGISWFR